jgi:spore coat polysaccharide biosynthesis predicted glycosyltransferase SpsG
MELIAKADLALGAGGSTCWERCCLGLPALLAVSANNQAELTRALADYSASINLGWAYSLTPIDFFNAIQALTPEKLVHMGQLGMQLVDGRGCMRVAKAILEN